MQNILSFAIQFLSPSIKTAHCFNADNRKSSRVGNNAIYVNYYYKTLLIESLNLYYCRDLLMMGERYDIPRFHNFVKTQRGM